MKPQAISNLDSNHNTQMNPKLRKNQLMLRQQGLPKDSISFGAGNAAKGFIPTIQKGLTKLFKFTDGLNFFFEFLIVDSISMISPRIWVGLNRDKEKTGHYNIKAAKEEAGRELLSGPSMNLLPMGILTAVCLATPATKLDRNTLEGFMPILNETIKNIPQDKLKDKTTIQKAFAGKLFDEIFGADKNIKELTKYKDEFCEKLAKSTEEVPPLLFERNKQNSYCKARGSFDDLVNKLNLMREEAPLNSVSASINGDGNVSSKLFDDFRAYSKDIIGNFVKKGKSIEKLTKARQHIKTATAITAFLAVGSFLLYLPKIYQQKGGSPAHESAERAKREKKGVE